MAPCEVCVVPVWRIAPVRGSCTTSPRGPCRVGLPFWFQFLIKHTTFCKYTLILNRRVAIGQDTLLAPFLVLLLLGEKPERDDCNRTVLWRITWDVCSLFYMMKLHILESKQERYPLTSNIYLLTYSSAFLLGRVSVSLTVSSRCFLVC